MERKFQGAKWPGNERARERVGQGANRPESYWPIRSRERIGPGAKRLGTMNSVSVSNILEVSSGTNALYRHDDGSNMQSAVMNDIMNQCKGFNVMIFSDGSVYGGSVGYGSCAAVLYPLTDEEEIILQTSRVQRISDLHSKFALRPHHVPKYGKHPISEERNRMKI